jgi:hypothetical protein
VVEVEVSGSVYGLTYDQAKLLAETLRGYAAGSFQEDVALACELSGNAHWADGALAVADFIEEVLVENLTGPLPLEGKAAEATFWTLRIMEGLGGSRAPTDMAALRDALGKGFTDARRPEAA